MTDDRPWTDVGETSRRRFLAAAVAAGTFAGVAASDGTTRVRRRRDGVPEGDQVGLKPVAEGFTAPLGLEVALEARDRRFVVDQPGRVHVVESDGLRDEPFLDVSDRVVDLGGASGGGYDERGLLGLAFHPDFVDNRRLFVHYSAPPREGTPEGFDHTAVVSGFVANEGGGRADPDSEQVLLAVPSPGPTHNGGRITFGPDGFLYVPLGDGGGRDDAGRGHASDWYDRNGGGNGQDVTENLLGSILRIDVDGGASESSREGDGETADGRTQGEGYAVPEDNPLVGEEGLDEQYAWGFRDPRHLSFDSRGRLLVVDAGWNGREEVNLVEKGGNYGWNVREGTRCFDATDSREPSDDCPDHVLENVRGGEPLLDPVVEYPLPGSQRPVNSGSVLVGGHVQEADVVEHLRGKYVFGDWSAAGVDDPAGQLLVATPPERQATPTATPTDAPTDTPATPTAYELDATTDGWQGKSPSDVEAELNPTLTLAPGRTHEVTWQNLDGEAHNFALADESGEVLVSSPVVDGKGMSQTFEFEATPKMAEYRCKIHPTTMSGSVELAGGSTTGSSMVGSANGSREPSRGSRQRWTVERLIVDGNEDGRLDGYVYGVGRGTNGELYVLTGDSAGSDGDSGAVYRLVPSSEDGSDGEVE